MEKPAHFKELLLICLAAALFLFILPQTAAAEGYQVYLGQLHSHSGYLDDITTEGHYPADVYQSAKEAGMDFFAVTDFSHSLENAKEGAIDTDGSAVSPTWQQGKEAARAASDGGFTAIYGYEMSFPSDLRLGHIVTLSTPGWQCRGQEGMDSLTGYYQALTQVSGPIGMFCHPGIYQGDFEGFSNRRWDYDESMALVEVWGENGNAFLDGYQAALDQGWHVAPAANGASHKGNWGASHVRTGILAADNSEASLMAAIRARRVYATTDPALNIQYSLGGHIMGSQVTGLGSYEAAFQLSQTEGTVEFVTAGGAVVASCNASQTSITLPAGHPYYYLRLVREGQVTAVTAPVWVTNPTDFGMEDMTLSEAVPVQGEGLTVSFALYNHEQVDMTLDSLELRADGEVVWQEERPFVLEPGQRRQWSVDYTHPGAGTTRFEAVASGSIGSLPLALSRELEVSYRPAVLRAQILVDGRHSDAAYQDIENLTALAAQANMEVAIFRQEQLEGAQVLIVPAPIRDFSEDYPQVLKTFVENGGQLILCGQAGENGRLNRLLEELGSSMTLNNHTAQDPVNNGGSPEDLYPARFNPTAWGNLTGDEVYCQLSGCSIATGAGTWLVKSEAGEVLLAQEDLGKGRLYLAGSFFMDDDHMPLPKNSFDPPRANQRLLEAVLAIGQPQLPLTDIQAVRGGEEGQTFRVRAYVTAGTSDENNRFPDRIYLQDETGGIAVTQFSLEGIETGTCLDLVGQRCLDGQNPALKLISCQIIEGDLYRFAPDRLFHQASMNYERHGGELMKVEGIAQHLEYTADGQGIRRFTLSDPMGYPADILIEDYILSGTYGWNHLAQEIAAGDTVRVYGILHLEDSGDPVLRVRNCDEVVQIPPVPEIPEDEKSQEKESTNPKTGDAFFTFSALWGTMSQEEG